MTATRQDISGWFDKAIAMGAHHLIIAHDTYDHTNYPVYVTGDDDVRAEGARIRESSMQAIDEVYSMEISKDLQMAERRAFNWG